MAIGDWERGHTLLPIWGGGRDRDSPALQVRRKVWTATMGLDLIGGDG